MNLCVRHLSAGKHGGHNGTVFPESRSHGCQAVGNDGSRAGGFLVGAPETAKRLTSDKKAPREKARRPTTTEPARVGRRPLTFSVGSGALRVFHSGSCATNPNPGRAARHRPRGEQNQPMHDGTTSASEIDEKDEQLTAQLTAFNRVLLRKVKSESPHGGGIYSGLTDLTDSLRGEDIQGRVRARGRAATSSTSLASEIIGKFGKIEVYPRAVMRFLVNRRQSKGVECRLTSGKTAGWSA